MARSTRTHVWTSSSDSALSGRGLAGVHSCIVESSRIKRLRKAHPVLAAGRVKGCRSRRFVVKAGFLAPRSPAPPSWPRSRRSRSSRNSPSIPARVTSRKRCRCGPSRATATSTRASRPSGSCPIRKATSRSSRSSRAPRSIVFVTDAGDPIAVVKLEQPGTPGQYSVLRDARSGEPSPSARSR